jgi:hypothetical protein
MRHWHSCSKCTAARSIHYSTTCHAWAPLPAHYARLPPWQISSKLLLHSQPRLSLAWMHALFPSKIFRHDAHVHNQLTHHHISSVPEPQCPASQYSSIVLITGSSVDAAKLRRPMRGISAVRGVIRSSTAARSTRRQTGRFTRPSVLLFLLLMSPRQTPTPLPPRAPHNASSVLHTGHQRSSSLVSLLLGWLCVQRRKVIFRPKFDFLAAFVYASRHSLTLGSAPRRLPVF